MIIHYLGFTVAGLLFLLSLLLFVVGSYNEIRYSYKSQSPLKPSKSSIRYQLWGAIGFGGSLLVFLTTENGFNWETLGISIFLIFLMAFFIGLHHFVWLKTSTHLYKENVPLSSLFEREKDKNDVQKADLGKER